MVRIELEINGQIEKSESVSDSELKFRLKMYQRIGQLSGERWATFMYRPGKVPYAGKLTEVQKDEIMESKLGVVKLAKKYGVTMQTINYYRKGRSKHISNSNVNLELTL